jgi:hypothetical protein
MAAGLGFKTFTTGEVLTAADTNGYLMQGVLVFASAAARDAAITSPQEGQFAYLKDTNVTTYYTGSAWTNLDTTGMTNPMTTTGDMVYSSSGSTPARLGIGTTGQVITVAGGIPSWATPAASASGLTFIQRSTFSAVANTGTTFDGIFSSTYSSYIVIIENFFASTVADDMLMKIRIGATDGPGTYSGCAIITNGANTTITAVNTTGAGPYMLADQSGSSTEPTRGQLDFPFMGASGSQMCTGQFSNANAGRFSNFNGTNYAANAYTGLQFSSSSSNIYGTISVYGLAKS